VSEVYLKKIKKSEGLSKSLSSFTGKVKVFLIFSSGS
jgi:hypothetical protein